MTALSLGCTSVAEDLNKQIRDLEKKLRGYSEKQVPRATAAALNKSIRKVKSQLVKTVAKSTKVKAKAIRAQVFTGRAKSSSLSAYVKSYLRPISAARLIPPSRLSRAAPRGTSKKGVRVAGQMFTGAFVNVGKQGGRKGAGPRASAYYVLQRTTKNRYPLQLVTIKIDSAMKSDQLPISEKIHRTEFVRLYEHELKFRTTKYER